MGSAAIKNPGFDLPVLDAIFLSGSRVMVDGFETLRVLQRHGPISLRHKEGCNKDTRKVATNQTWLAIPQKPDSKPRRSCRG
jgi:hypothetical protein